MTKLIKIDRVRARHLSFYLGAMLWKGRVVILIPILIIVLGGLLISLFDEKSLGEGQYLAFITASTIGYGDLAPESWPARIVACAIGLNGLLLTGIFVALSVKGLELAFRADLEEIEDMASATDSSARSPNDES